MSLFTSKKEREAIERCRQQKIENEALKAKVVELQNRVGELENLLLQQEAQADQQAGVIDEEWDSHYRALSEEIVEELRRTHPTYFNLEPLGITSQNCPYCGIALSKFPSRKTRCPSCGGYFYPRKRPQDEVHAILTEGDVFIWKLQNDYLYSGSWKRSVEMAISDLTRAKLRCGCWVYFSNGDYQEMHGKRIVCDSEEERVLLRSVFLPGGGAFTSLPPEYYDNLLYGDD